MKVALVLVLTLVGSSWATPVELDGRIIGGYRIPITTAPYQVSVQFDGAHICGGSIIQADIVLTAAHCFPSDVPVDSNRYTIRAGSSKHSEGGQLLAVKRIKIFPGYTMQTLDGDVTVLLLERTLQYSHEVLPIPVASQADALTDGSRMYVSGWGLTSVYGQLVDDLNEVMVRLYSYSECIRTYRDLVTVTENMFCAGYAVGGRDSCQGDSGGPLVSLSNGEMKLFGIVSWGIGCGDEGFPGVYTRVNGAVLSKWIDDALHEMNLYRH